MHCTTKQLVFRPLIVPPKFMVLYAFRRQPQTTSTASILSRKPPHFLNVFLQDTHMFLHYVSSGSSGYAGVGNVNTAVRAFASGVLTKLHGCLRHCILYLVRPFIAFQLQKSAQWLQFTGVVYGGTEILILGDCRYATQFLDNFSSDKEKRNRKMRRLQSCQLCSHYFLRWPSGGGPPLSHLENARWCIFRITIKLGERRVMIPDTCC